MEAATRHVRRLSAAAERKSRGVSSDRRCCCVSSPSHPSSLAYGLPLGVSLVPLPFTALAFYEYLIAFTTLSPSFSSLPCLFPYLKFPASCKRHGTLAPFFSLVSGATSAG